MRELTVFGVCLLLVLAKGLTTYAQQPSLDEEIEDLLKTSSLSQVLAEIPSQLLATAEKIEPTLTEQQRNRLASAVAATFAERQLHEYVVASFRSQVDGEKLTEVRRALQTSSIREIHARFDSYKPKESFEQYAQRVQRERPPQARIDLMTRMVESQHAPEFYVRLTLGIQKAAHSAVRKILGDGIEAWTPPSDKQISELHERYAAISFLNFLQRFESLSDAEVEAFVGLYERNSGQWYVKAYTQAIVTAIEKATEKLGASLAR